jgi:hypothetical protein
MRINEKLGGMAPEDNNEGFFALFDRALTRDHFVDTDREREREIDRLGYGWGFNSKARKTIESRILEKQNELASLIAYQASKQPKTQ